MCGGGGPAEPDPEHIIAIKDENLKHSCDSKGWRTSGPRSSSEESERSMEALRGDKEAAVGGSAEPALSLELEKGGPEDAFKKWTLEIRRKVQGQSHQYRGKWQNYRHDGMGAIWEHSHNIQRIGHYSIGADMLLLGPDMLMELLLLLAILGEENRWTLALL